MQVKTILNQIEKHSSFVYEEVRFGKGRQSVEIEVRPRRGARPVCSGCGLRRPAYDTLAERRFQFVLLWGFAAFLLYSMRRVNCGRCGVRVESVPWSEGKRRTTISFEWFLATWSKRLCLASTRTAWWRQLKTAGSGRRFVMIAGPVRFGG